VQEVDKLVNDSMANFIKDNNIQYILEPLPIEEKSKVDFQNPDTFVFAYEYALRPEVNVDYSKLPVVKDFRYVASEEEIDRQVEQLRERYGNYTTPEVVETDKDNVSVKYGEDKTGYIFLKDLTEKAAKKFVGKKVKETVKIKLREAFAAETSLARFLRVDVKDLEEGNAYEEELTIDYVGHLDLAEINEEFFKKAFPDGSVKDEKTMREAVAKMMALQYETPINQRFMNDAIEALIDNVPVELPDDFVKRYILVAQKDMTPEKLETEYNQYKRAFQWQLIENKLLEENEVQVNADDVRDYFRKYFIDNYFGAIYSKEMEPRIDEMVNEAMKNQESVKQVYDMLFDMKLANKLRDKLNIEMVEGDGQAFMTYVTKAEEGAAEAPAKKPKAKKAPAKKAVKEEVAEEVKEEKAPKAKTAKPKAPKKSTKKEE
jgi:trigger factor